MMRFAMLLQVAGAAEIPPDFDLRAVRPSADPNAIVVTGRRPSQRIEPTAESAEPPLGRAEIGLFGQVKGNLHVESQTFGNGTVSQRLMVGIKLPF